MKVILKGWSGKKLLFQEILEGTSAQILEQADPFLKQLVMHPENSLNANLFSESLKCARCGHIHELAPCACGCMDGKTKRPEER